VFDDTGDAWAQDFYRRMATIRQHCKMNLRDRRTGHRQLLEALEDLAQRTAIIGFQDRDGLRRGERGHLILQLS
jgi:hypothetical protein